MPPPANHTCKLLAVGDIMLHGRMAEAIERSGDPLFPFRKIQDQLQDADILFGNLETMITRERVPWPGTPGKYFSPPGTAKALQTLGFTVVNIGHNHSCDWGSEGFTATVAELEEAGIAWGGFGPSPQKASRPAVVSCPTCGRRFAFACFVGTYNTLDTSRSHMGCPPKTESLRAGIEAARGAADVVVVSIHGGACLNPWPSPDMLSWCRDAAAQGADIVLGHHAHVFNGIETRGKTLIAYALPDFVRPFPFDKDEVFEAMRRPQHESLILHVEVGPTGAPRHEIIPCLFDDSLQTRPATQAEAEAIRARMTELSRDITDGTSTARHLQFAGTGFGSIYLVSLFRTLRRGGLKWLWSRMRNLSWYHVRIVLNGIAAPIHRILRRN